MPSRRWHLIFPAACIFNEQPVSSPGLVRTGGKIMAWVYLIIAGLLEIGWAIGLKYTDGFTRLWPSVATIIGMLFSFGLLSIALKTIPVGTGYAVWTGIGAAGTAIIGMMFLGESKDIGRLVCLGLIVAGVIGLKMFTKPA
ncbi:MAG: quaternary ammonium compound-resistance protein SugE [Verrucomicrobia bacterium]|nr:quaternary ammonium compound-resistance protein SugE [Verrucomicrobiota bacterium]